jgi:hypothetical protein
VTLLVGLLVASGAAAMAGPAAADHCDPNSDPNCGPHVPNGPGGVTPPCNGSVGPVHAWPCAAGQTIDCTQAATSPESCDPAQVTVHPTAVGPVTVNGASTAPVTVPVPNAYAPAGPVVLDSRETVAWAGMCVKTGFDPIRCFHGGP